MQDTERDRRSLATAMSVEAQQDEVPEWWAKPETCSSQCFSSADIAYTAGEHRSWWSSSSDSSGLDSVPHPPSSSAIHRPSSRRCLMYAVCRQTLAWPENRKTFWDELKKCIEELYAAGTSTFVTANELLRSMPLLKRATKKGDVCKTCAAAWIEETLKGMNLFETDLALNQHDWRTSQLRYDPEDIKIIQRYLAMMGGIASESNTKAKRCVVDNGKLRGS